MKKRELTFIVVALVIGAVSGGLIGDIIGTHLPPGGAKTVFTKSIELGLDTVKFDFYAVSFTFGLTFKFNFMSVLVVILVIFYFRYWYL